MFRTIRRDLFQGLLGLKKYKKLSRLLSLSYGRHSFITTLARVLCFLPQSAAPTAGCWMCIGARRAHTHRHTNTNARPAGVTTVSQLRSSATKFLSGLIKTSQCPSHQAALVWLHSTATELRSARVISVCITTTLFFFLFLMCKKRRCFYILFKNPVFRE